MMAAFPRTQQGVAGGLAFLARALGSAAGVQVSATLFGARAAAVGFMPAFQGAFLGAAVVAGVAAALGARVGAPSRAASGDSRYDDVAMDILDPTGTTAIDQKALAPRPASLAGAVIGILDNSKPNAHVLLSRVAEARPRARTARARSGPGASPTSSSGALPAVLDEIAATATVALTASAD